MPIHSSSTGAGRIFRLQLLLAAVVLAGCAQASMQSTDVSGPGTRPFEDDDGDRETVLIQPKSGADNAYDIRPALLDTALIRAQYHGAAGAIIEVLIKGTFPDGCSELNELDQEPGREGQLVSLTMRRPADAICTQVVRPYRFFFTLDRRFEPGEYVLTINGHAFDFRVEAASDDA